MRSFQSLATTALLLAATAVPAAAAFSDPVGDTFNAGTIDITSVDVVLGAPTTIITLNFASPIAAPSAFAANSVVGFIDLDTDQNAATGGDLPWGGPVSCGNNWINFFVPPNPGTPSIPGPLVALGDEFYIDLGSELFHPGLLDVVNTNTNLTVGVSPVIYAGSTLTVFLPSALIGSPAGLNFGVLVGDFLSPTDRAPNGERAFAVPEPSSLAILGLGLACVGCFSRRRSLLAPRSAA